MSIICFQDHINKLASQPGLYEFLQNNADKDGNIMWSMLRPRFIWNVQSISEAEEYLALQKASNSKDSDGKLNHIVFANHLTPRRQMMQFDADKPKVEINASILIKQKKHLKKVEDFLKTGISEEELAKIMYPGLANESLRLLYKILADKKINIPVNQIAEWRQFIANGSERLYKKMINNVKNLDVTSVQNYLNADKITLLDVLNNKDLEKIFDNMHIQKFLALQLLTPMEAMMLPIARIIVLKKKRQYS